MKDRLEDHLAKLCADGEFVESSEFTLNTMKAAQKLSEYQLPSPCLWAVKFVQAAVAFGSEWCTVDFYGRSMEVSFALDIDQKSAEKLFRNLVGGSLSSDAGPFHLLAGIRGSVEGPTQKWLWSIRGPKVDFAVECDEGGLRRIEAEGPIPEETTLHFVTTRPLRFPSWRKALRLPVKYLVQQTAEEYLSLLSHCWSAPLTLKVDKKTANDQYKPASELASDSWRETSGHIGFNSFVLPITSYLLLRRELPGLPGRPPLDHRWVRQSGQLQACETATEAIRQRVTFFHETWIDWKLTEGRFAGGHLLLILGNPLNSRIDWVCDGAVVDCTPLPWSETSARKSLAKLGSDGFLSLRVLLPVTHEELDLSQFRLRESQQRLEEAIPIIEEELIKSLALAKSNIKSLKLAARKRPRFPLAVKLFHDIIGVYGPLRRLVRLQLESFRESVAQQSARTP